jgi:hypothetical protein
MEWITGSPEAPRIATAVKKLVTTVKLWATEELYAGSETSLGTGGP